MITYIVDWVYNNVASIYRIQKPVMLSSAKIKYVTLSRTFNCNNATEQLGYKPIISLKVVASTHFV
jgi:sterol-4alpha-carboxylate 3-dehydrogenase (decarboxylating)